MSSHVQPQPRGPTCPCVTRALLACAWLLLELGIAQASVRATVPRVDAGEPAAVAMPLVTPRHVTLDGQLDDEVWRSVPLITGFKQREPLEGAAATHETEVRVAFDERALYVAIKALDPEPDRIVGLRTRRDTNSPSDWIRVLVDSFNDHRTAFEFAVNPAGVRVDRYWFNDTSNDDAWDAVWDVAVSRQPDGWTAEFRIPLSQLRYGAAVGAGTGAFGFAVVRQVARLNETSSWPLLPRSAQGFVSQFGQLSGLSLKGSPNRLELVPYAVANVETQPASQTNPLVAGTDPGGHAGLDFKYAMTPGMTLTGTVNPDFGQVEADPAVVNLSAFETFFPERRPFFLEGSGIFRFDMDCEDDSCSGLFYSRRIGRAPRGEASVPDDGYSESPTETTILGAAKATGRAGDFSFGALNAITGNERATVVDGTGLREQTLVEPLSSYTALRTRREWRNQSALGGMLTATNRSVPTSLGDLLVSQAYAGGVDGDWQLSERYRLSGNLVGSAVFGEAAAIETLQTDARHLFQRPDARHVTLDPTRTSLTGHSGQLALSKNGGERMRFRSSGQYKSPGFDINELGFLRRADTQGISNWLQVRHDRPWRAFRAARLNFNQWASWNFDDDRLSAGGNINGHLTFNSSWGTGIGFTREGRGFDDRLTRGGPGGYEEPRRNVWGYIKSDDRRFVSAEVFGWSMHGDDGSRAWEIGPLVTMRPSSALQVGLNFMVARNANPVQWVEEVSDGASPHYVFGDLDQKTTALGVRVNYAVSPTLSIQLYGRPYVSTGAYGRYSELVDGRAPRFEDRYAPYAYDGDADFRYRSFRMTNVVRWEFRPGSTLFVVWQQGREDEDSNVADARNLGGTFNAPATNIVLVKLAYWINP